jgi:hypothetical protein
MIFRYFHYAARDFLIYTSTKLYKVQKKTAITAITRRKMIGAKQIQEILSLYKRHGWNLRRVLLSEQSKISLTASIEMLFGTAEIVTSEIDAVWFSRPSAADREAWEIRHLGETPYALIEVFDAEDDEEVRDEARHEIEQQLKAKVG